MIDYKSGKVVWDNSQNWERDEDYYHYDQDILQVVYGEHCIIDVGDYSDGKGGRHLVIMVVDQGQYQDEEDKPEAWSHPYACIPCRNKSDMLVQLQRAIDVYPEEMNK